MQLTYEDTQRASETAIDLLDAPCIRLDDLITASLISLFLWSLIGWTAWALVS